MNIFVSYIIEFIFFIKMQLILIIYRFCMWEFAYLLKFICNPLINTHRDFTVIGEGHAQSSPKLSPPIQVCTWGQKRQCSAFIFQLSCCKQGSFRGLFSTLFSFSSTISLLEMAPSIVKCYPVFLHSKRVWCALQRKCTC